jgi:hypothetical protein
MATIKGGTKVAAKLAEIGRLAKNASFVKVGFLSGATYPDGKPVAMIAAIQEFGAPAAGIPPRPFFRNMIDAKQSEWPKAIADLLKANGYDAAKTLEQVGQAVSGQLKQSITDTNDPPLKPATVRRKGFAKPLVDTGHMLAQRRLRSRGQGMKVVKAYSRRTTRQSARPSRRSGGRASSSPMGTRSTTRDQAS